MTILEPFVISLIQQSIHHPLQIVVVPLYYCARQFVFQLVSVVKQFVVTKRPNVHGNGSLNLRKLESLTNISVIRANVQLSFHDPWYS